jgi:hypothetical protein
MLLRGEGVVPVQYYCGPSGILACARYRLRRAEIAEPTTGIEPVTSSLPRKCSTPELRGLNSHKREGLERETGFEPATLSLEG